MTIVKTGVSVSPVVVSPVVASARSVGVFSPAPYPAPSGGGRHRGNRRLARLLAAVSVVALLTLPLAPDAAAAPVDINSADAQSLSDALTGIGPVIANAIVDYREQNGPFTDVDDLLNVKGVGPKILERNRRDILIGGKASDTATE